MKYKCLFLDRDGVINYDYGHVGTKDRFKFKPGIFNLIKKANNLNYLVIVITNQAGIGKGFYSDEEFKKLSKWMLNRFQEKNCFIHDVFYCPYHPTEGKGKYLKNSFDRKPLPGMLIKAATKHKIDLNKSILVGDKHSDIEAGQLAGIKNLYLIGNKIAFKDAKIIKNLKEINFE